MVTVVWVVSMFRLRTPLAFHLHISPLTASGRRNRASWASRIQKSVTLRHSQRADHEVHENMWKKKKKKENNNNNNNNNNNLNRRNLRYAII
jgi:hypothetical protein